MSEMVRLGDVVNVSASNLHLPDEDIWLLNLDMVEQQTGNIIDYNYVSKEKLNGSIIQFDTENVLYSKLRPNLNKVVIPKMNGYATSEMLPLRPNMDFITKEYLCAYLRSDSFVTWAVSKTSGAKMPRLGTKELLSKTIPLPPLSEQRHIAAVLDKVSELIALRKRQLDLLDEMVKARFVEMFGDQKNNEKKWIQSTIGNCCTLRSGTTLPSEVENEGGDIPYVKVGDMNIIGNEYYITTSSRFVSKKTAGKGIFPIGCVIFPKRGGAIGTNKKRLTTLPICADLNVMGVIPTSKIKPRYLKVYFDMIDIGTIENGSSVPQINNKDISPLIICIPPIELQNQFDDFVQQVDKSKAAVQQGLDRLNLLKSALMQEYFG